MNFQIASDLHLEFKENSSWLAKNPLEVTGDILLLAGDIGCIGNDDYTAYPFWDWASEHYQRVIIVLGNHEFYRMFDLSKLYNGWTMKIRKNVDCYYNAMVPLGEKTVVIATTLWSHINPEDAFFIEHHVSDFAQIRYKAEPFGWEQYNMEHDLCMRFLKTSVTACVDKEIVVMSHHVPFMLLMSNDEGKNGLEGAYAVELKEYIVQSPVKYWIYGHSRTNIDAVIGQTCCICNQLGLVSSGRSINFQAGKYFEL